MEKRHLIRTQLIDQQGRIRGVVINPHGYTVKALKWSKSEFQAAYAAGTLKLAFKLAETGDIDRARTCLDIRDTVLEAMRRTHIDELRQVYTARRCLR